MLPWTESVASCLQLAAIKPCSHPLTILIALCVVFRASLVVQMPGWTGLANARVTIFGDVFQLPPELQPVARDVFLQKHSNERKERWVSGNFVYFRMNRIVDIYFVGGFGTVQWLDPAEYLSASPDEILLANPNHILQVCVIRLGAGMQVLSQ